MERCIWRILRGFYTEKTICIITYNELQAKKLIKDLTYFEEKVELFPKKEVFAYDYLAESKDTLFERIDVLNNIINKESRIIVTTIEAIMQPMISKQVLYKNMISIRKIKFSNIGLIFVSKYSCLSIINFYLKLFSQKSLI